MIPANKKSWFSWLFRGHVRRRMRGHFSAVRVLGLEHLRQNEPIILFANHSSWWDSLVLLELCYGQLGLDGYALMHSASLKALPFLGWIGGFGVDVTDPTDGDAALRYAAKLLDRPGRLVALFPQGAETPWPAPLLLKPGLAKLAALEPNATLVPLSMRYEHGRAERPFLLVKVGAPCTDRSLTGCTSALAAEMSATTAALLDGTWEHWPAVLNTKSQKWLPP